MLIHVSHLDNLSDDELLAHALAGHSDAAFTFCRRAEHFGGMPLDGEMIAQMIDDAAELKSETDEQYDRVLKLEGLLERARRRLEHIGTDDDVALVNELEEA